MAQSTYSLDMGGGGNYVRRLSVSPVTGSFTVCMWVKPASLALTILLGHGGSWRCQMTAAGHPQLFDGTGDDTFGTLTLATGAWHALAFRVSGTTCKCFLRPSGGSSTSESLTVTAPGGSPSSYYIGDQTFGAFTLSGKQDHAAVFASALADGDIESLLAGTASPSAFSPALFWDLEEGAGTTTADQSGNGYTGTFSGAPAWSADVAAELAGAATHFLGTLGVGG